MFNMKKAAVIAGAIVLSTFVAMTPAKAVTLAPCGSINAVPADDTEFFGTATGAGGAGSCSVFFNASKPLNGLASATIGKIVLGTFTGLTASWINTVTNAVINTTAVGVGTTNLTTYFSSPSSLQQKLVLSWTGSKAGAGFDYEVSVTPVPVPAALPLLATGLLGMGLLARRRKSAAKV